MTERPLVSVIVPVHDGERFLAPALRSVFEQTYRPIEVIVVDDGSTDGSAEVASSFPVRYLHQENRGPGAARNAGIQASRGELVAFVDADDVMLPHKLETQAGFLLDHPEVDCVMARQRIVIEDGVDPPEWVRSQRATGDDGVQPLSAVIRRGALDQVGGFDPRLRVSEDLDLLFRLRQEGLVIETLPQIVMVRRVHGANLTYRTTDLRSALLRSVADRVAARREERSP